MSDEQNTAPEAATDPAGRMQELVSARCYHIGAPMTLDELAEYIESDEYSAELALQHALILLVR